MFLLITAAFVVNAHAAGPSTNRAVAVQKVSYHGWTNSLVITNNTVEVVVVPAIGRIMQFKLIGSRFGPFWENHALDGDAPDPNATEWMNFGGDKVWPAPQSDWPKIAKRAWPPPPAFDSMPWEARVDGDAVTLISPVDPHYGIRVSRRIRLDPKRPMLLVTTTFEKMKGPPQKVAIWVVTQFRQPVQIVAPLPTKSIFTNDYVLQSETPPPDLQVKGRLLSMTHDPDRNHKIGLDTGTLVWMSQFSMLRIDSPRVPRSEYPDNGSSAEIYTNSEPLPYVELEMLGPLRTLSVGEQVERTSIYTLFRRMPGFTAEQDAETILRRR